MGNGEPVKKRRHHHVWQEYLRAWAQPDGKILCKMHGKIIPTGTSQVAVESFFYKIPRLTEADVALIRFLVIDVNAVHPRTRKAHEDFLALVTAPTAYEGESEEVDDLIHTFRCNALEDYHAGIEGAFLPLLKRALEKDLSFYADEQSCISLFLFLASQHMRTKGIRVKTIDRVRTGNGLDISRVWIVMSHMLAFNIGMGRFLARKKIRLVLVENATDLEFIAGDQPLINLHGDGETSPDTLSWYYPISPRLALLLPEVGEEPVISTATLTSEQVRKLNLHMAAASHRQVFAHSRFTLDALSAPIR